MFSLFLNNKTAQEINSEISKEVAINQSIVYHADVVVQYLNSLTSSELQEFKFLLHDIQSLVYHMKKNRQKVLTYGDFTFKLEANKLTFQAS